MITVKRLEPFKILYELPDGTNLIVLIGGRGGAKTYETSKYIAYKSTIEEKRIVILRDEKELIRESILNEVLLRYDTADREGLLSQIYERLETGIKDRRTNSMVVFTKGFRASTTKKTANLKGVSDIDIAVVEEAEDIRDPTKFNTFADSIRKEGSIIIIILNTPDIGHWIVKRFFNVMPITFADVPELKGKVAEKDLDGYFKLVPKKTKGFVCVQTSFADNPHLPKHIIHNYKAYGDPESTTYDLHYYLTAIKGFASTGRKGQVLRKVKPITLAEYLKLPYKEYYGQDFGTARPAGMVGVKRFRNTSWCRQLNYEPLPTLEIGKMYCRMNIHPTRDEIVADNADSKACDKLEGGWSIEELDPMDFKKYPGLKNGWNIIRARKGADSINFGIENMTGMNLFAVEESEDLWDEVTNYVYAQDKYGNYTNDPIDDYNHLIDPWRYVLNHLDLITGSSGMERGN
jgi:phage terminase large subunit